MPLEQYLKYIEGKTLTEQPKCAHACLRKSEALFRHRQVYTDRKKKLTYARIIQNNGKLTFTIPDSRLGNNIPIVNKETHNNGIVALKWINTRNTFSKHVLRCLLHYQSEYWYTGKDADLKPFTLKQFLLLYPLEHLDQSRLSRLLPTLIVETPQGKIISLRELLPTKKRCYAYCIEELINKSEAPLKDNDIQSILVQQEIRLSLRTICNCRKLLNIPNYKQRLGQYYGKDIRFSEYIKLTKGQYNRIPSECGVYELSSTEKINYLNYSSNILYIGSSKNIRKRLMCYTGTNGKNKFLKHFTNGTDIFIRYYFTKDYLHLEKHLLRCFKKTYGELPKTNKLGG